METITQALSHVFFTPKNINHLTSETWWCKNYSVLITILIETAHTVHMVNGASEVVSKLIFPHWYEVNNFHICLDSFLLLRFSVKVLCNAVWRHQLKI